MDGRKNNGGAREGAGRPKKEDEAKLIERLDSIIDKDEVIHKLKELIQKGDMRAITIYLDRRYGKPTETRDITLNKDLPLFID
jgi:hypothetical protein